jgi:carboxypeptidase Q
MVVVWAALLAGSVAHAGKRDADEVPAPTRDELAANLMGQALASDGAWDKLVELCDDIGHRISGSPQLEEAVAWSASAMEADNLVVSQEPIMVPVWERGPASATLTVPITKDLPLLALGGSISTPEGGITAPVVVAGSFEALTALGKEAVEGKIVVWNRPFTTYGETVQHRVRGAIEAARLGAVASLTRSVTPVSLSTPHTGMMRYDEAVPKIPSAAITIEDAELMQRYADRGVTPTIHLELEAHDRGEAPSANVIGEVPGGELADEVVVIGCHLDSWDVGQGAQDDGAGCVMAMEAGRLLASLPRPPRRTVRVVLFTNEENGLRGGTGYASAHAAENTVACMEADTGAGRPLGFGVDVSFLAEDAREAAAAQVISALAPAAALLEPLGADALALGYSGADIGPTVKSGAIGLGLRHDMTGYWPIHHTTADTLEKIDKMELRRNVATFAVMAWYLADLDLPILGPPAAESE